MPTLDDAIWRTTEPGTPPPRQRLAALTPARRRRDRRRRRHGADPAGLSDRPELLRDVVQGRPRRRRDRDLDERRLFLRPGTREHFLENLARDWPELLPRYRRLYAGRAYLGKEELEPVRREVADLRHRFEIADRRRVRLLPVVTGRAESPRLELPLIAGSETDARSATEAARIA